MFNSNLKMSPLLVFILLVICAPSHSEELDELNNWSFKINFDKFAKDHFDKPFNKKRVPIDIHTIQMEFSNSETISDGSFSLNTHSASISLIGNISTFKLSKQLEEEIKPQLPKPGCKDSNGVRSTKYAKNLYPNERRIANNKGMRIFAQVHGTERACDWPHKRYGRWSKDFWLDMILSHSDGELNIIPSVGSSDTKVKLSSTARLGKNIADFINDIGKGLGIEIDVEDPNALANTIDKDIGREIIRMNQMLSGEGIKLDGDSFFSEEGQGLDLLSKFSWDSKSGFTRHRSTVKRLRGSYGYDIYSVHLIYSTLINRSDKSLLLLSQELQDYMSKYALSNPITYQELIPQKDSTSHSDVSWREYEDELRRAGRPLP